MKCSTNKNGFAIGVIRNERETEIIKHLKKGIRVRTPHGNGVIRKCTQRPGRWAGVWEVRLDKVVRQFNSWVGGTTTDRDLYFSEDQLKLVR